MNGCVFYKIEKLQSENSELKSENQELKEKVKDIDSLTKSMNLAIKDRNDTMIHNVAQSMRIQELKAKLQELQSQIEKMKNCDNCKNKPLDSDFQDSYNSGYFDPYCSKCIKYSNWELG